MLPLADFERFGHRNTVEGGADAALRCGSMKVRERRRPYFWMIDQFIFNEPQNDSERYQCKAFRALNSDRSVSTSHSPAS
jgi:hypothetical protein